MVVNCSLCILYVSIIEANFKLAPKMQPLRAFMGLLLSGVSQLMPVSAKSFVILISLMGDSMVIRV